VGDFESSSGHSRCAEPNAGRVHWTLLAHDAVLVDADVDLLADLLEFAAAQLEVAQVDQTEVGVGAPCGDLEPVEIHAAGQLLTVEHGLLALGSEGCALRVMQLGGQRGYRIVMRPALQSGEHCCVDLVNQVALSHNESTPWTS